MGSTSNTAIAGTNYVAEHGTVVFAPGETSKTITIVTLNDNVQTPNTTLFVNLSNSTNSTHSTDPGIVTIIDNTPPATPTLTTFAISPSTSTTSTSTNIQTPVSNLQPVYVPPDHLNADFTAYHAFDFNGTDKGSIVVTNAQVSTGSSESLTASHYYNLMVNQLTNSGVNINSQVFGLWMSQDNTKIGTDEQFQLDSSSSGDYCSLNTIEGHFEMLLSVKPTSTVTISMQVQNLPEAAIFPKSVTFTPENWNIPQDILVEIPESAAKGMNSARIITNPAESQDPAYSGYDPEDVNLDFSEATKNDPSLSLHKSPVQNQPASAEDAHAKAPSST